MSSEQKSNDDVIEKIKILATDDEKIKSFGEIFTNDASREILQLLFNEDLTATQIAQRIDTSLQLVKYHLNKLQNLGIVKISKIEKNSKSQDMKIYSATKFSIVIVPPTLSEKTKESKLLVRSFRHIYKIAGLGISAGFSGILSLSSLQQQKSIPSSEEISEKQISSTSSIDDSNLSGSISADTSSSEEIVLSSPVMSGRSEQSQNYEESPELEENVQPNMNIAETTNNTDNIIDFGFDIFVPFAVITVILGGLTLYYLWKYLKKPTTPESSLN